MPAGKTDRAYCHSVAVRRSWQRRPLLGLIVLLVVVLTAYLLSRDARGATDTDSAVPSVSTAGPPPSPFPFPLRLRLRPADLVVSLG